MKPEVNKIFEDLEAWQNYCRLEMIPFVPSDLYKSSEYKAFARSQGIEPPVRRQRRAA